MGGQKVKVTDQLIAVRSASPRLDSICETLEDTSRRVDVDACIGYAHAILELPKQRIPRLEGLLAFVDMTLDHDTNDALVASGDLLRDRLCNDRLVRMYLFRIAVTAVDHDARVRNARLFEEGCHARNAFLFIVVRPALAAA